jgi:hypothetical protein
MSEHPKSSGGCLRGNVRYEALEELLTVAYCNCASCRKHNGTPVVAWAAYETRTVRWPKGQRAIYESSPGVVRAFCRDCGTPLTWEGESRREGGKLITEFHISTLDDPEGHVPKLHWFDDERLSWFETDDKLPRYRALDGDKIAPSRHG